MALSGVIKESFHSGKVEWSMEWSAETSILTGKAKLTINVYLDTSAAYKISTIDATSGVCFIQYQLVNYYFDTPKVSSKGRQLMGTVTINNAEPGSNMKMTLEANVAKFKVYSSLTSYVETRDYFTTYGYVPIDEVERISTANLSGTLNLNVENTITVTKKHTDFKTTVKYTCGTATKTLFSDSANTTFKFTLPLDLAKQNTKGTTVSVTFTVITRYNGGDVGSVTITKAYNIPASVKPSCSISVSESTSYGVYLKGLSRLKIVVTPTTSYGSAIASYSVSANGLTYTTATVETGALSSVGTMTITATVKDNRGRTGTASTTITVFDKSVLTVADGTLGTSQTLTVTQYSSGCTHSIKAVCGTSTYYVKADGTTSASEVKHDDCSIPFTPPIGWSSQEPENTVVSVSYTITTYYGNTKIGECNYTKTYAIPSSVKPSCTVKVTDAESLTNVYGNYVQRHSRLSIVVTPTISYGSAIVEYEITANGVVYRTDENTVTTAVLKNSGQQTISVVVTDGRGRTGTASVTINVLPWAKPDVIRLSTFRTDADGKDESGGEFITAHFDVSVSPLNNKNSASYMLRYQKIAGTDQHDINLTAYNNKLSVTEGTYTFKADKGSVYEVTLFVTDDFDTGSQTRGGSNAVVLMHFGADGESIGIGGYATLKGVLDVFFKLRTSGGFMFPEMTGESLFAYQTPGVWWCDNIQDYSGFSDNISCPACLVVLPCGDNDRITQIIITCPDAGSGDIPEIYLRQLRQASWGAWYTIALMEANI